MRSILSIDIANSKSEVLLMTEYGEVLIEPYEIKHFLSEFTYLNNKIKKLNLNNLTVFYGVYFNISFTSSKIFYKK